MSKNHKVLILVLIAIILGYAIYNQQKAKSQPPTSTNQPGQSSAVPSAQSEDERFILNPPSATSSAELKKKHADTVAKLAKVGSSLEIKDCKPNILVLQVKQGDEFEISNGDKVEHNLTFDEEHSSVVPANGKIKVKADFKYGSGDYGYVCKGLGLVGFLHIIP